jgi:hypothetical protein
MTHSIKAQIEMVGILRDIALALEKSNEIASAAYQLQDKGLRIMEQNSKANHAFHLQIAQELHDETD